MSGGGYIGEGVLSFWQYLSFALKNCLDEILSSPDIERKRRMSDIGKQTCFPERQMKA